MAVTSTCANHIARIASGICRHCSKPVCNECVTKIEGINVCAACLARSVRSGQSRRAEKARHGMTARSALFLISFAGMTGVLMLYGLLLVLLD